MPPPPQTFLPSNLQILWAMSLPRRNSETCLSCVDFPVMKRALFPWCMEAPADSRVFKNMSSAIMSFLLSWTVSRPGRCGPAKCYGRRSREESDCPMGTSMHTVREACRMLE